MTENQVRRAGSGSAKPIAYFVTDHGYGHATRAAAVMGALSSEDPDIQFEIFTTAPRWLFDDQQAFPYRYHQLKTDVGLIQSNPFEVDLRKTVYELERTLPFEARTVAKTAKYLENIGTRMIICDIAPIGISVSVKSGIPSVLVENFTWDWIYAGYHDSHRELRRFSDLLGEIYARVQIRIQVQPFCLSIPTGLKTSPVCRPISPNAAVVRSALSIPPSKHMVLLSMGGLAGRSNYQMSLPDTPDTIFVIPGGSASLQRSGNVIMLPSRMEHRHPDLVSAADVVIGKVGYGTLAEVYQAGTAFGYLTRDDFRESAILANFIDRHIPSIKLDPDKFTAGDWHDELSKLLTMPRARRDRQTGAQQAAFHIINHLGPDRLV